MTDKTNKYYVTTPIYYVNDRPHIGHIYSTTIADIVARYHRLLGDDVFFLTGVDEHAAKVSDSAAEHDLTPQQWADENSKVFQNTFTRLEMSNNDFIRTSQDRHKNHVTEYFRSLMKSGDVYPGEYEGWYDAGQEEYIPENKAKEYDYKSPINGKDLVRKRENNYFFKLSKYQERLLTLIETQNPTFVQPEARRNEVLARIKEGLNDVPISRSGTGGWGIPIPDDPTQSIYVWIDALFNYLSTIDETDRIKYWPADVHFIAKDILWFHAVIWPAILMALDRPLPKMIYSHSFWISEGKKMSKSLGNFIDLEKIDEYINDFSLDAIRYYLATQGPMGATDSDFAHDKFVDVYNAHLANTLGNCASRVGHMINRYFDGKLPEPGPKVHTSISHKESAQNSVEQFRHAMEHLHISQANEAALNLVRDVNLYIEETQPFKLAKEDDKMPHVGTILYNCAEALRIASIMLWPVMPNKMQSFWQTLGMNDYAAALDNNGTGDFNKWTKWGKSQPGTTIAKTQPLFPRSQE